MITRRKRSEVIQKLKEYNFEKINPSTFDYNDLYLWPNTYSKRAFKNLSLKKPKFK
ncbi:hypothetical protein [Mesomycoplasma neurolyticum]|uniref:Uncharacterized protein n=1 Tax=Mesomycoplasma neurolyticum TaxID=2120 RepID=A0A449A5E0_9BACT|nr:hypothetical protein [Mesomycoplasma neurolyticum]VEU59456.1 Uncharacterised protein [Mesomycoplasma neurolyticum]